MGPKPGPTERWLPNTEQSDAKVRSQAAEADLAFALEAATRLARQMRALPERHRALVWSYLAGEMMENGS